MSDYDVWIEYKQQGCRDGCMYRGKDIIEYEECHHQRTWEKYTTKKVTPICLNPERSIFSSIRAEIYQRADKAKVQAIKDGFTIRTAQKRWDKIAEEWRNFDCYLFRANDP